MFLKSKLNEVLDSDGGVVDHSTGNVSEIIA